MGCAQQQEVSCGCYLHSENYHQRLLDPEHLIDRPSFHLEMKSASLAFGEKVQCCEVVSHAAALNFAGRALTLLLRRRGQLSISQVVPKLKAL